LLTTLLPYVAQTGEIRFAPEGAATMRVKAVTAASMKITNLDKYAGQEHILFSNNPIPKEAREKYISANTQITVTTKEYTYTCIPSQE
jgi:hypothetical protein